MGRWMVPACALGEICCNGHFDPELHALTAEFVLDRQGDQQRAAAHATAYQPPRERPSISRFPALFRSESTDLQTDGRSATWYEWQQEQRVLAARRLAHEHVWCREADPELVADIGQPHSLAEPDAARINLDSS